MLCVMHTNLAFANKDLLFLKHATVSQVGRYVTVTNRATIAQIDPLLAIAQFKFQPEIITIGDAIEQVLRNTSYKLASNTKLPSLARQTLSMSLPITVRELGPVSIKEAVVVLMGKHVFNIKVDMKHRTINFLVSSSVNYQRGYHA